MTGGQEDKRGPDYINLEESGFQSNRDGKPVEGFSLLIRSDEHFLKITLATMSREDSIKTRTEMGFSDFPSKGLPKKSR